MSRTVLVVIDADYLMRITSLKMELTKALRMKEDHNLNGERDGER